MLPSASDLLYFIEVANSLNLSRASERLGISQPSLSLAIKRLEISVGTPILTRHKYGVRLTQAGKQFLAHAKQLLQYWDQTRSHVLASHLEVQGNFTIGCHSTMAIHSVSGFLPELLSKYPKLEIKLKHDISRKILEEVVNLSIDIGIVANPLKHPDLVITKLCNDEVTFWSANKIKNSLQNMNSENAIIICDPELTQTQALLKKNKKSGFTFNRVIATTSLEVVANLTAKGCGIGILPSRVAQSMYPKQLKKLENAPVYEDELCLIYRHENRNVEAMKVLVATIKDYFRI